MTLDFFETPSDVACELVATASSFLPAASPLVVVDACAGTGALASAAHLVLGSRLETVCLVDLDPCLLQQARRALAAKWEGFRYLGGDVLDANIAPVVEEADLVLCNPPFRGYRACSEPQRAVIRSFDLPPYNDLACSIVLGLLRAMKDGAIAAFLLRRDLVVSRGYDRFRRSLDGMAVPLAVVDLGRRLRASSGKAISCILILQKKPPAVGDRKLVEVDQWSPSAFRLVQDNRDWVRLGDVATVMAGPNTGADHSFVGCPSGECLIRLPASSGRDSLWGPGRLGRIRWCPEQFTQRRALRLQGLPGCVYRLMGAQFVTSVLPAGFHFLSSTPAVIPLQSEWLDGTTGCMLSRVWRDEVRNAIRSTNFTPGAVADLPIPGLGTELGEALSAVGKAARHSVERSVISGRPIAAKDLQVINTRMQRGNSLLASALRTPICEWPPLTWS